MKKFFVASIVASSVALFVVTGQAANLPKCSDDSVVSTVEGILHDNGIGSTVFDQAAMDKWQKEFNAASEASQAAQRNLGVVAPTHELKGEEISKRIAEMGIDAFEKSIKENDQKRHQTILDQSKNERLTTAELKIIRREKPSVNLVSKIETISEISTDNTTRSCSASVVKQSNITYQIFTTEEHGEVTGFSVRVKWR